MLETSSKRRSRRSAQAARWCERFERLCRERGLRITPQRMAVYQALAEDPSHPSADRLFETLKPRLPALSLMTVYRILESFENAGVVRRVSTTGGVSRFDANVAPHQHLVCRRCGRMSDYHAEGLEALPFPSGELAGFLPYEIDVRIVGLCARCQARQTSRADGPRPARAARAASSAPNPPSKR